ncbi:MAG: DUF2612 domain-containing protein, partial [candidate division Zixibacteria bacterium]|nr:DUF2612 domain-containing protein [candidate division Zixibacteria bacterium]
EQIFKSRTFGFLKDSPNIQALIEIFSDPLQDTWNVLDFILDHSSIDTAEGEQLEYLGSLIGVERPRKQETRIFTLCREGEIQDPDKTFKTDETPGGYLGSREGLFDQDDPDAEMNDADYRYLIRQKAAAFRNKATREILFLYLIAFGCQAKIDDDETLTVWLDPVRYADLNSWSRNYIETRGFKPAGISVRFIGTTRHGDSI